MARGVYAAQGNSGQRIVLYPQERLVIVKWAVWNNPPAAPSAEDAIPQDHALFTAIVDRLR